ncbi:MULTISPECIES: hypothetical protein [unclassified Pseudomonas]|uniref:hypothetical protein n=1 Tax=unclassified Pseudomonas TaxID=196821 RepID=UPI0005371347|nr:MULTISPECIES: hypothetical protein [unclassified Pseudomonas]CDF96219.1 hypothetical protein BN844_1361 [Pseudomonas sp. SHC52]
MREVLIRKIQILYLVLFFAVLLSGIFLPIYSDEVVTKFRIARFFLEEGNSVTLFPQCTATTGRAVAWIFYPVAMFLSAVYAHLGPLGLRISGIFLALIWFGLLAYWCLRQAHDLGAAVQRFAGLVAVASLGVLPFLWVMSRPEHLLVLAILVLCLSALFLKKGKSPRAQVAMAIGLAFLLSFFFYAHPKSLFYMPFALAAVWSATATYHKVIRYGLLLFVFALCVQVVLYFGALGGCQDAPYVKQMLAANTLLPGMLFSAPFEFLSAAYNNLISFPERMLPHLTFNATYQSGWLPPIRDGFGALPYLNFAIEYVLYAFIVVTHVLSVLVFLLQVFRRRITVPVVLALLLVGANVSNAFFYNIQNFYAGVQFVPVSIIIAALLMHTRRVATLSNVSVLTAYSLLLLLATASLVTLSVLVTPGLVGNAAFTQSSLPGQPLSIPVFGIQPHLESITKLGASCNIPAQSAENVVVDHMTYFAYLRDKQPIHVLYVSEIGYGGDLSNGKLLPFLKGLNSPGLITRCEWVPYPFREAQEKDDKGYCCVNFGKL